MGDEAIELEQSGHDRVQAEGRRKEIRGSSSDHYSGDHKLEMDSEDPKEMTHTPYPTWVPEHVALQI